MASNGNQARRRSQPSAISATPATESEGDVVKCYACHTYRRSMSPSATPTTQTAAATTASNGNQARHQSQPSATPQKAKVDVVKVKCHTCHMKCRSMSPSATPATPNDTGCRQVPRLPHMWASCVCVSKLCARELCVRVSCVCVSKLRVRVSCVWEEAVRE